MEQGIAANPVGENGEHQSTGYPVGASIDVWRDSPDMARYAPITSWLVAKQLGYPDVLSVFWIAFTWALLALMIYVLVLEITKRKLTATIATLLVAFSMAGIQIAWTLYNTQPIIELLIVFGIYTYIKYRKTGLLGWYILLIISCIIAPLVRELAIIVPITLLALTIIERRWDKYILISMPILLLYNVFPSTIPNLILFGKGVVISQFSRGAPLIYMSKFGISDLGLSMTPHLLLYLSPILIILALISVVLFIKKRGYFPIRKILALWLVISWFPFLWLYNGADTILLAPAIPLIIIMTMWICRLPSLLKSPKITRPIFYILLFIGLMSLPFNVIAVQKTFSGNDVATRDVSAWLKENIPQNSIVISNLIHGEELQWYADGWFDHYYGFPMSSFPYNVTNPTEFYVLVNKECSQRDIYIVAGLSLPSGEGHWLLKQEGITVELQKEFIMSESYPINDPLKTLLPPNIRPYGGAPDLVNEIQIYNVNPFVQQAYARYGIYKVIGMEIVNE
jgi:hypothetical protein